MSSSSSLCSLPSLLHSSPSSSSFAAPYCLQLRNPLNTNKVMIIKKLSTRNSKVFASRRDHDFEGGGGSRLVDENMIVLRKRIYEMKMVERNYEAPADWMEWEKRYYTSYGSIICEAMKVLQSQLMNTRPSLALGMMAFILLSVPTSSALICFHLMEITKGVLAAGFHVIINY